MNKKFVAKECCGSCGQFRWSDGKGVYICLDPEVEKQDVYYLVGTHSFPPLTDCYTPRNPIPITDLPGVKELVKDAYRAGYTEKDDWPCDKAAIDWLTDEYMKALEAK